MLNFFDSSRTPQTMSDAFIRNFSGITTFVSLQGRENRKVFFLRALF